MQFRAWDIMKQKTLKKFELLNSFKQENDLVFLLLDIFIKN